MLIRSLTFISFFHPNVLYVTVTFLFYDWCDCVSVLCTVIHSLHICHLAIQLYCIVLLSLYERGKWTGGLSCLDFPQVRNKVTVVCEYFVVCLFLRLVK